MKVVKRTVVGDFGIPAVPPSSQPTVQILVLSTHVKSHHVGVQGLLSLLREKFWILKGLKSNQAIFSTCNVCRRHEAKHITASPPVSPAPWVCWYGGSTLSARRSQDVGYVCTPVRYIMWFTWNWPCQCPMIPLFRHLFPDVDSQWLSTATMGPILRIPQRPSEVYCSEASSVKAQWERYEKKNLSFPDMLTGQRPDIGTAYSPCRSNS